MQLETTTHPEKTAASLAAEIEQRRDRLATLQREQSEVRGAADSARAARVTAILNGSKPGSASTIATLVEQWSSVGEAIEVISG
ncbi:MAG: hypothetical protein M3418_09305, partial [Gemmatimonadota bacterium]|nr:hypothetical protein [Gemmatimonadota bacterium]